jgi:MFS family permease
MAATDGMVTARTRSIGIYPYGWMIVACLFVLLMIGNGLSLAGISVFDDRLLTTLKVGIGALKFRDLVGLIASGAAGPFVGWAADRYGTRPVIAAGTLALAVALFLYSDVTSIAQVYGIHILLGFSFAANNIVVVMILLTRWFPLRRGLALGIVLAGTSIGGAVFPQVVALLLAKFDWREVFRILAILPLLYLPALFLLVREHPSAPPAMEAGERPTATPGPSAPWARFLTVDFLVLALVGISIFYSANAMIRHTFLYLRFAGAPARLAAAGLSAIFLAGLVGKISSGFLIEWAGLKRSSLLYQGAILAGILSLLLGGPGWAPVGLICIGFGWGGGYTVTQFSVGRFFAGPAMGRMLGVFVILESTAQGCGSWLTGLMVDAAKSYTVPFVFIAGLLSVALVCNGLTRTMNRIEAMKGR